MLFYGKFKYKFIIDKLVSGLWIVYLLINVMSHYIIEWFGGIGNIAVVYAFLLYFLFIYGSCRNNNGYIRILPLIIFAAIYCFIMQLIFQGTGSYYETFGIKFDSTVWNMVTFVPMMISAVLMVEKSGSELIKWIKGVFLISASVTIIFSVILLLNDFSALKVTATSSTPYYPFVFGFQTISGFSVIAPFILYNINNSDNRIFNIIFCVAFIFGVLMSSFFIAIIALILGIGVYLIFGIKNRILRYSLLTLLIFLIIGFSNGFINSLLLKIAEIIPMEEISKRLQQILLFFQVGITGDTTTRFELYSTAFNLIFKHPIFGNIVWNPNVNLSGHSMIMDVWGGCGIIPVILFCVFLYSVYKYNKNNYCNSISLKSANFASLTAFLFTIILNPLFASPNIFIFFIIAPMIFSFSSKGVDL